MHTKWLIALGVAMSAAGLVRTANAGGRDRLAETVDLWSWRAQPAAAAPATPAALRDQVLSGSAPAELTPVVARPDAPVMPDPNQQASQMLTTPMLPEPQTPDMTDNVKTAWGCVIGGTAGTGLALAAGAEDLINLVAGGIVAPGNPVVLAVGLVGVVFGTFCTLGQAFTPLYVHYFDAPGDGVQPAKDVAQSMVRKPADRSPDVVVAMPALR